MRPSGNVQRFSVVSPSNHGRDAGRPRAALRRAQGGAGGETEGTRATLLRGEPDEPRGRNGASQPSFDELRMGLRRSPRVQALRFAPAWMTSGMRRTPFHRHRKDPNAGRANPRLPRTWHDAPASLHERARCSGPRLGLRSGGRSPKSAAGRPCEPVERQPWLRTAAMGRSSPIFRALRFIGPRTPHSLSLVPGFFRVPGYLLWLRRLPLRPGASSAGSAADLPTRARACGCGWSRRASRRRWCAGA